MFKVGDKVKIITTKYQDHDINDEMRGQFRRNEILTIKHVGISDVQASGEGTGKHWYWDKRCLEKIIGLEGAEEV